MKLTKFRVTNFRSVNNSGDIAVSQITSLVGRNESGKSNLLLALATLNPPGGRKPLNKIKDFPRGRRLDECTPDTHVVWTWWALDNEEQEALGEMLPALKNCKQVVVGRGYGERGWVDLGIKPPEPSRSKLAGALRRLEPSFTGKLGDIAEQHATAIGSALTRLGETLAKAGPADKWATENVAATKDLRTLLSEASIVPTEAEDQLISQVEAECTSIVEFDGGAVEAREAVLSWLPTFTYVAEFPEIYGHQNLDTFLNERGRDPNRKEADDNFEKMAKVAGFSPKELNGMRGDHETRNQLLNRAGAVVTTELRRLWKDRPLKVRYNIDGPYLDTLISDPNAVYDVEVNLDERSRGFRWFFSFYLTFAADTKQGGGESAILLLDEPGLFLHAKSQEDLLRHFKDDFKNQIIYTTHSPFMVAPDAMDSVRTVNIDEEKGTQVTNTPKGDSRTLFPLQAALGYQLAQTLFVGHSNLVVEGVTDFWILSAVHSHFQAIGAVTLPDALTITPAGGAGKVSYMAALLASQELTVLVLLDDDKACREAKKELVEGKLLRDSAITLVSEGMAAKPKEADIEDLIDPGVYKALVDKSYAKELKGKKLTLNTNIPRIVKRYEEAFEAVGLEFQKSRPAREFMTLMGSKPIDALPNPQAFQDVFALIKQKYERIVQAGRAPFR